MLNQIHIRDLATIEEQHLHLTNGATMITGETGAGKSIFIEAIELALGARGSANLIRAGKERADISLCFDIAKLPKVVEVLKNYDLYQDGSECIIRRVLTSDGRSRSYVNGLPATQQLVRELGELLFHLHGQYEQQVLLKAENQRELLDRFADHMSLANEVKQAANEWKRVDNEIRTLRAKTLERTERSEYLRFQLDELAAVRLQPGEWEALEAEHHKLTHSEELLRHVQHALHQLAEDENDNILSRVNELRKSVEAVQAVDRKANEWVSSLVSAAIQLADLETELRNYLEGTELDPERLQELEVRIGQIFELARKHKVQPQDLMALQARLQEELSTLDSSDTTLAELEVRQKALEVGYHELALRLSKSRAKAVEKLTKEITLTIRSLSLPHGEFKISLDKELETFSPYGLEKITFLIKTNPDQVQQPLAKVISGGELSRLSLAVHLALAHRTSTPTLVFDEVDTGVGGATAEKIGKLLKKLGESYQVFCVTHQAQVAACGHQHFLVEKYFIEKSTHTRIRTLNQGEKVDELARMLGGEKITQTTFEHAKEMLALA